VIIVKCTACDGKGSDGYHKEEVCPVCGGTGEIKSEVVDKPKSRKKKTEEEGETPPTSDSEELTER